MGAVVLVEIIEIGLVLEIVGVKIAVFGGDVGQHIVVILHDFQCDSLLFQQLGGLTQDLGVRRDAGSHLESLFGTLSAAGGQRQCQKQYKHKGYRFFHFGFSLFQLYVIPPAAVIYRFFLLSRRSAARLPTAWKPSTITTSTATMMSIRSVLLR